MLRRTVTRTKVEQLPPVWLQWPTDQTIGRGLSSKVNADRVSRSMSGTNHVERPRNRRQYDVSPDRR
jgi:hypothetical protein